jgi:hypothetical protein
MLEFSATAWTTIIRELDALASDVNLGAVTAIVEGKTGGLVESLERIAGGCRVLGLDLSVSYAEELAERLKKVRSVFDGVFDDSRPKLPPVELARECAILRKRIDDQLAGRLFFAIPGDHRDYYEQKLPLFGPTVQDEFSAAGFDIEEAGKCFALGRYTACVMHLMRVLEVGLDALKVETGIASYSPTWKVALDQILKTTSTKLEKDKTPEERARDGFIRDAVHYLTGVKDAVRNPVMHKVARTYTDETAKEVFAAVRAFMRHLATKLSKAPGSAP